MSLSQYKNLVITQPNCPYCVKAKALLDDRGTEYTTLSLGSDLEKTEMVDYVETVANIRVNTVPQIFLEGKYIGGHDDLVAYLERQREAEDFADLDFEL
ncbi:glutaredoxin [Vibrio sp. Of7-15]|uniref:glutaredoxin domain-containing protein n=1 Tax=Vibrio sp. Of7-15 TaxID=2724879 RepID=UPI001EF34C3E|nr:glutaredoxin domain-containing protein [Vibrio sp. Of7-15]MCG7498790.1 glutaredoxin [Vibrio sp. Of7-15]